MKSLLTEIQEQKFKERSGIDYKVAKYNARGNGRDLSIITPYPYNNLEWDLSPWGFSWIIEKETGNLITELSHRMTNNRIIGWDVEGNELSTEITHKYYEPHF